MPGGNYAESTGIIHAVILARYGHIRVAVIAGGRGKHGTCSAFAHLSQLVKVLLKLMLKQHKPCPKFHADTTSFVTSTPRIA